ncbi:MAG: hypothetical protein P4L43_07680 [Syntrophobacteraceae bacterium]|nr:hypothetical protein [Syntrophobacteraceae bacterium]
MRYTLGEAAKATDKSIAAISRAIKNGCVCVSAEKQDNGSYKIAPAELHRVYRAVRAEQETQPFSVNPGETGELRGLQARIEAAEQRQRDKDNVIDDLRRRLDAESEERRRTQAVLTGLLTYQREKQEAAAPEPKRGFWRKLFAPGLT